MFELINETIKVHTMAEINLMKNYPRTKRDIFSRLEQKTKEHQNIARLFGKEFFDGTRDTGYGGFKYDPRYWSAVIPDFVDHFKIQPTDSLLDVGCAKGFMLADFKSLMPDMLLRGIDISEYAVENAHPDVGANLMVGDCAELPFENNSFDYVISITTVHNHDYEGCMKSLSEIQRVAKKGSFITVDAYTDETEKKAMFAWNLTAKTILSVPDWIELFKEAGYTGDYFWFVP